MTFRTDDERALLRLFLCWLRLKADAWPLTDAERDRLVEEFMSERRDLS